MLQNVTGSPKSSLQGLCIFLLCCLAGVALFFGNQEAFAMIFAVIGLGAGAVFALKEDKKPDETR